MATTKEPGAGDPLPSRLGATKVRSHFRIGPVDAVFLPSGTLSENASVVSVDIKPAKAGKFSFGRAVEVIKAGGKYLVVKQRKSGLGLDRTSAYALGVETANVQGVVVGPARERSLALGSGVMTTKNPLTNPSATEAELAAEAERYRGKLASGEASLLTPRQSRAALSEIVKLQRQIRAGFSPK